MRQASRIAAVITMFTALGCAHAPSTTATSLAPEQVRMIQRALTEQGHPVALTGTWDRGTQSALLSFQRSHHLPATGTIDPATADALGVDPNAVQPVSKFEPTSGYGYLHPFDPNNPEVNCAVNNTVDCRPAGGP